MSRALPTSGWARRAAGWVAAASCLLLVSACQGAYDLPLPGGAATGSNAYHVTVEFADVLDLVPQSAVKVNDVTVGAVDSITLKGWTAQVHVRLMPSVHLPANAVASLSQTSLLGEKFVQLSPPTGEAATGQLKDGAVIPLARTSRTPEVEEVLGALSLLLNGGGVAQLKIINSELTKVMQGHEGDIKSVISQLGTFVAGLDAQKGELVRAIDALDRLSGRLAAQKQDIAVALDQIPGGLKVLADQRAQLTTMLTALSNLGAVGTRVISESKADTVANLQALAPVLTQLSRAGDALPKSLQLLLTYPFPDASVKAIKGDYTNLHITADLSFQSLSQIAPTSPPSGPPTTPGLPLPTVPGVPGVPKPPVPTCLSGVPVAGCPSSSSTTSSSGSSPSPAPSPSPCLPLICVGMASAGGPSASAAARQPSFFTTSQQQLADLLLQGVLLE